MNTLKLKLPENTEISISHENGFRVVEIKAEKVDIQVDDLLEIENETTPMTLKEAVAVMNKAVLLLKNRGCLY